jgi:DNA-binding GntR family transcriptional regulator
MALSEVLPVRQTAHEWVRDRLRSAVLAGDYPPGSRLVQTEIAERFGLSVTPVREAMRDLVAEGLIRLDPHKAATVRELDLDEALEINDLRLMLEPVAVRRATPHLGAAELAELEELQRQLEADPDDVTWVELNHRWHTVVLRASHSPRLTEILTTLRGISRFYLAASLRRSALDREKSNRDHHRMMAAFRAGDVEAAGRVMDEHLPSTEVLGRRLAVPVASAPSVGEGPRARP